MYLFTFKFSGPLHTVENLKFLFKNWKSNIFVPNLSIFKTKLKPKFKSKKWNFEPKMEFYHSVPLLQLAIDGAFGAYGEASGGLLASLANALPNFAFFIEQ